jgi:hypothetical protein
MVSQLDRMKSIFPSSLGLPAKMQARRDAQAV